MPSILVVDDMAVFREPIAAALRLNGYTAYCAGDGIEALEIVHQHPVDLVLLDIAMPRMDGLTFLQKYRKSPEGLSTPVLLLSAVGAKESVVKAAQLGIQGYMLKAQFSLEEMMVRIQKCLNPENDAPASPPPPAATPVWDAAHRDTLPPLDNAPTNTTNPMAGSNFNRPTQVNIPRLLSRDATIARMEEQTKTKTLAGVVAEVIAMTSSLRGELSDLVTVLQRDPLLATRVLHVANSAAFASRKIHIATLEEAVRNIGLKAVRNIALSIGIFEAFPTETADGFNLLRSWQHSFATASIMEWLANDLSPEEQDLAHMVGLCHDLGEIVMRQTCANEFEIAIQYAYQTKQPLSEIQSSIFGMSSFELTGVVMTKLGLPPAIASPIQEFSESLRTNSASTLSPLAKALRLANTYAHGLLLASSLDAQISPVSLTDLHLRRNSLVNRPLEGLRIRSEVLVTTHLLARLSSSEEEKLMRPLIPPSHVKVWYTRHPSFTSIDPMAMALQLTTETIVKDRLPTTPIEYNEIDLLVVATPKPHMDGYMLNDLDRYLKMANRKDLPVLYLTGSAEGVDFNTDMRITVSPYPITMTKLANMLQLAARNMAAHNRGPVPYAAT